MKRLFLAVPVSAELKEKIVPVLQQLSETGADLNVVSEENLHLTLKFLGGVEEKSIPKIIKNISALHQQPFSLTLCGVGVFPAVARIRVIWIGIQDSALVSLMKKINQALNFIRSREQEETPHLTLVRMKSGKHTDEVQQLVEKYQHTFFGAMRVDRIILYESELGREGPKYTIMKEFPLL